MSDTISALSALSDDSNLTNGSTITHTEHNTHRTNYRTQSNNHRDVFISLETHYASSSEPTDTPEGKIWADTTSDPAILKYYKDGSGNLATIIADSGNVTGTPGTAGSNVAFAALTHTDDNTATSGTAAASVMYGFAQPTLAATNATVTTTAAATVYIANAPAAGTNMTLTNAYALWVDAGTVRFDGDLDVAGTVTYTGSLVVDNITISGNDISTTAGTDLTLTPLGGQQVVIDGGAIFDAGVVTGITSLTAGATVIDASGVTLAAGDDLIGSSTSDITFNTNKFTVAGATGNTVIAGTLGVTGVLTATAQSIHTNGLTDGTATLNGSGAWSGITTLATTGNATFAGNVGIGVTSPGTDLAGGSQDASGTLMHIKDSSARAGFIVEGETGARIDLIDLGGAVDEKWMRVDVDAGVMNFRSVTDVGSSFVADNILVLDIATGNVGIGNSSLESWDSGYTSLQIGGNGTLWSDTTKGVTKAIYLSHNAFYDGAYKYISTDEASHYYQTNGTHVFQYASSGTAGNSISWNSALTINNSGAMQWAAYGAGTLTTDGSGNITAVSDESLKDITGNFTRGLADIIKITPKTFNYNAESGLDQHLNYHGLIAQDVESAIPEAVYGGDDVIRYDENDEEVTVSIKKTVMDRTLIATIINSLKEVNTRLTALEAV